MNTEFTKSTVKRKLRSAEPPVLVTASRALNPTDNGKVLDVQVIAAIAGSSASTTSGPFEAFDFTDPADITFTIAGKTVALTTDLEDEEGLIEAIQTAMDVGGVTHVVTGDGEGAITVTAIAHTAGAIVVGGTDAAVWTTGGSSVAGVADIGASGPTLTIPQDMLPVGFACRFVAPVGVNLSVDPLGTVTLNGATSTLTRARAGNPCLVKFVMRAANVALLAGA